jgi:hypothetical protein
MKTKFFFIVYFVVIVFFIRCNSSDNVDNSNPAQSATTNPAAVDAKIDASIQDVSNIAEDQFSMKQSSVVTGKSSTSRRSFLPSCATATWTYTNGTFTGTIDFGTQGCALKNGNILKGKITLSFSGNFSTPIQMITYSFDEFYHNGNKIQGSKTITRELKTTDLLATVHPVFASTIDMTITFADGSVYTRKGNRTKELINNSTTTTMHEGEEDDDDWGNKIFLVTGTETTTFPNGDIWTNTIQIPLRYEMACEKSSPVSGTISKVKNDVETLIDYGTGDCDNSATATTNGVTTTIKFDD